MNAPRPSYVACLLRAISPAMVLVVVAMLLMVQAVLQLGHVTQRANTINRDVAMARATIAAETALLRYRGGGDLPLWQMIAGLSVELDRDEDELVVSISGAGRPMEISARHLVGTAPRAFSHARVSADPLTLKQMGGGCHEPVTQWPVPLAEDLAAARCVNVVRGFHRDHEIALQYLTAGTDRPDFVWRSAARASRSSLCSAILVVPGNLWIEAGSQPLELTLQADVVLVIRGNLHLLRSLRIRGPGRLLLVCDAGDAAVVFSDQDGSGGWSSGDRLRSGDAFSGPVEGCGSAYLGLPGVAANIDCDAGILVGGELHLAGIADVHGPLLLRHGVTKLANPAAPGQQILLRPPGQEQWIYRLGRDRIPGFAVSGPPRPGRLEIRAR
jgi:hypothetical protein